MNEHKKSLRIRDIFQLEPKNQEVPVQGWIRTRRESKQNIFFEINDGSTLKGIQVVVDKENYGDLSSLESANNGAAVEVQGTLVASPGKNQRSELLAKPEGIHVVGDSPQENYPLQKKRHSFEFLREIAHLRPRTNTLGAVSRVRNTMSFAIHRFFQERGFQYIHTPIITASDAEGAGEMFQVTTLPISDLAKSGKSPDYQQDFFGRPSFLTVSGQLEAEIYALSMKNVYTFGPTFRAENSNTSRHLAEFWMIEPEMAFCDIDCNMDVAEDFIKFILKTTLEEREEDMNFFNQWIEKGILDSLQRVSESTFHRITYTEAIKALEDSGAKFDYPVSWGMDLQSEHEKYLTEVVYKGPVMVTDYPKEIKAFYMKLNDDEKTVGALDVLVPRLGEIIGGSQREHRKDVLIRRIQEMDLDPEDYWWYIDLRTYGTVPHSGFGLGFERVIQYVTGMQNIRDVIPFPRTVNSAEF
ncbi:MAG: asparagine--tRNA ligase [Spirochaetales bacterium]|nr:asparagine--tRNA ligase [Spirochaetales bacterium]MCF7938025.1 asparagine--tRNA ligase [Spirochaetales bacterium]